VYQGDKSVSHMTRKQRDGRYDLNEQSDGSEVIHEMGFDNMFCYFGNERQIQDWPVVGEFPFIQVWFLKQWRDDRFR